MSSDNTSWLIAHYTVLINKYGLDSVEAQEFLSQHYDDVEFTELAQTARQLKIAIAGRHLSDGRLGEE